jgi:hypothetical protein
VVVDSQHWYSGGRPLSCSTCRSWYMVWLTRGSRLDEVVLCI